MVLSATKAQRRKCLKTIVWKSITKHAQWKLKLLSNPWPNKTLHSLSLRRNNPPCKRCSQLNNLLQRAICKFLASKLDRVGLLITLQKLQAGSTRKSLVQQNMIFNKRLLKTTLIKIRADFYVRSLCKLYHSSIKMQKETTGKRHTINCKNSNKKCALTT